MFLRKVHLLKVPNPQIARQLSQNQQIKKTAAMKMCRFIEIFAGSMSDRIRNAVTTAYLKLTLDPEFSMKGFLEACPLAIQSVAQTLNEYEKDERDNQLNQMMSRNCSFQVARRWDDLEVQQRREVAEMSMDEMRIILPKMLLHNDVEDERNVVKLRVEAKMFQVIDTRIWENFIDTETINREMAKYERYSPPENHMMAKSLLESISVNFIRMG